MQKTIIEKLTSHIRKNEWIYVFILLYLPFIAFNEIYLDQFWTANPEFDDMIYRNYCYYSISYLFIFLIFLHRIRKRKYKYLRLGTIVLVAWKILALFFFVLAWTWYEWIQKFKIDENTYYEYYVDSYWWWWWWEDLVINKVYKITPKIVDRRYVHRTIGLRTIKDISIKWDKIYFTLEQTKYKSVEFEEEIIEDNLTEYKCNKKCEILKLLFD